MSYLFQSKSFRKWLAFAVSIVSIAFFFHYFLLNLNEVPAINWGAQALLVAGISVFLVIISIGIVGVIWGLLLQNSGISIVWSEILVIFAISQFGKYLPGNVGQHVGRVLMSQNYGIPIYVVLSTMIIEILWAVAVAGGFAFLSLLLFVDTSIFGEAIQIGMVETGLLFTFLLILPWLAFSCINRFMPSFVSRLFDGAKLLTPTLSVGILSAFLFALCFIITGVILKMQAVWLFGVETGGIVELTCLFTLAWLAGYLVPGAPGGLGVREAMIVLLISPLLGAGAAVGLSVTMRLTTTIGDGVTFLLGLFAKQRLKDVEMDSMDGRY